MSLKIGNAQGFWGDRQDAPKELIANQPDLDFLTLEYLAEISLGIMAIQKEKNPLMGYAGDFISAISSLIPFWRKGLRFKVITNAGGLNPTRCAEACLSTLKEAGCEKLKIAVVSGDDVLEIIQKNPDNYPNMDTYEPLGSIVSSLNSANAYLGAKGIAEALHLGADIVITGRVADPSLTVGPCLYHFGWRDDEYHQMAQATVAGHLIECGQQVTGGISTHWLDLPDLTNIGYPVVEIEKDGSFIITKPAKTGGEVSMRTVKEQLLYEIFDPEKYISPDAIVSFLSLNLEKKGVNRIRVKGASGSSPPDTYKVCATYLTGFQCEGSLSLYGFDAATKARKAGEVIFKRAQEIGYSYDRFVVECLGSGDLVPVNGSDRIKECVLRIAASSKDRGAIEYLSKEIAPLVTGGPQGLTGYTTGRPKVRPCFGFWPTKISRKLVKVKVELVS